MGDALGRTIDNGEPRVTPVGCTSSIILAGGGNSVSDGNPSEPESLCKAGLPRNWTVSSSCFWIWGIITYQSNYVAIGPSYPLGIQGQNRPEFLWGIPCPSRSPSRWGNQLGNNRRFHSGSRRLNRYRDRMSGIGFWGPEKPVEMKLEEAQSPTENRRPSPNIQQTS